MVLAVWKRGIGGMEAWYCSYGSVVLYLWKRGIGGMEAWYCSYGSAGYWIDRSVVLAVWKHGIGLMEALYLRYGRKWNSGVIPPRYLYKFIARNNLHA